MKFSNNIPNQAFVSPKTVERILHNGLATVFNGVATFEYKRHTIVYDLQFQSILSMVKSSIPINSQLIKKGIKTGRGSLNPVNRNRNFVLTMHDLNG